MPERLPAHYRTGLGSVDYTQAGMAAADLASALMSIDGVLQRTDLTAGQRRGFLAAQRATRSAAQSVRRHVDVDGLDPVPSDETTEGGES